MKYVFEVGETIEKVNSYTIEVKTEEEAEELLERIYCDIACASNTDDILGIVCEAGYEVIEYCEGSENCQFELL